MRILGLRQNPAQRVQLKAGAPLAQTARLGARMRALLQAMKGPVAVDAVLDVLFGGRAAKPKGAFASGDLAAAVAPQKHNDDWRVWMGSP